jgi:hypothetical protein
MFGAFVVIVLVSLVIPISMLLAAIVFDVGVVAWMVFQEWHDHWSPKLARIAKAGFTKFHHAPRHHHALPPR